MFAKQLMTRKDKKMAKKGKTIFVCQECGYESTKWMGRCICGAWNSMVEEKQIDLNTDDKRRRTGTAASVKGTTEGGGRAAGKPSRLSQVTSGETSRIDTGIGELNRVLGGGLVPGSLTLIFRGTWNREINYHHPGSSSYRSFKGYGAVCFRRGIGRADQDQS